MNNPPTILDMERTPYEVQVERLDMMDLMGDPCPTCGGWSLRVGDWVCWGSCYRCFVEEGGGL